GPQVDVRTFRDDSGYVVDVVSDQARAEQPSEFLPAPKQSSTPSNPAATPIAAPAPKQGPADGAAAVMPAADKPEIAAPTTTPATEAKAGAKETPPAAQAPEPPPAIAPRSEAAPADAMPAKGDAQVAQPPSQPAAPSKVEAKAAAPQPPSEPTIGTPQAAAKTAASVAAQAAAVQQAPAAPAKAAKSAAVQNPAKVAVALVRDGANLKLSFPFLKATAAAVFGRADTLWLVFDSTIDIDLSGLDDEPSRTIRAATLTRTPDADIVRIKLDHPHLSSVDSDGAVWTVQV